MGQGGAWGFTPPLLTRRAADRLGTLRHFDTKKHRRAPPSVTVIKISVTRIDRDKIADAVHDRHGTSAAHAEAVQDTTRPAPATH